jgi:hypothetical protein
MNLRMKAIALILTAMATFTGGAAAFADDDDKRPVPGDSAFPKPHQPHKDEDELHERYGDVGQVNLPPLVIKQETKVTPANTGQSEPLTTSTQTLKDAGNANPAANLPVDPKSINSNKGTPAETFFNVATVGLAVMGLGVMGLGGFAVRRSIRLRKDPKADFLYQ